MTDPMTKDQRRKVLEILRRQEVIKAGGTTALVDIIVSQPVQSACHTAATEDVQFLLDLLTAREEEDYPPASIRSSIAVPDLRTPLEEATDALIDAATRSVQAHRDVQAALAVIRAES